MEVVVKPDVQGRAPTCPRCTAFSPEQMKAGNDAAFAVGALVGALGAVGREVIATQIQRKYEAARQQRSAQPHRYGEFRRC